MAVPSEKTQIIQGRPRQLLREAGAAFVLFGIPLAFVYFDRMYLLFSIPLLVVGVLAISERIDNKGKYAYYLIVILTLVLTGLDSASNLRYYYMQAQETPDYESVGTVLKRAVHSGEPVLFAGQGLVAYYADAPAYIDYRSISEHSQKEFTFVVIDSRYGSLANTCLEKLGTSFASLQELYQTNREPIVRI